MIITNVTVPRNLKDNFVISRGTETSRIIVNKLQPMCQYYDIISKRVVTGDRRSPKETRTRNCTGGYVQMGFIHPFALVIS